MPDSALKASRSAEKVMKMDPVEATEKSVTSAMISLSSNLKDLQGALEHLKDRLGPVLCKDMEETLDKDKEAKQRPQCPLADQLYANARHVDDLTTLVHTDILDLLDI
jgi:hypothetical protein